MKIISRAVATMLFTSLGLSPALAVDATKYKNCSALNKVYPGGVSKSGAVDMTKKNGKSIPAKPKKAPVVDDAAYAANPKLDRDKDGIACEK
jgi:hypothetical protein